jgi:hypothetical protein
MVINAAIAARYRSQRTPKERIRAPGTPIVPAGTQDPEPDPRGGPRHRGPGTGCRRALCRQAHALRARRASTTIGDRPVGAGLSSLRGSSPRGLPLRVRAARGSAAFSHLRNGAASAQFGGRKWAERLKALAERLLHLLEGHDQTLVRQGAPVAGLNGEVPAAVAVSPTTSWSSPSWSSPSWSSPS